MDEYQVSSTSEALTPDRKKVTKSLRLIGLTIVLLIWLEEVELLLLVIIGGVIHFTLMIKGKESMSWAITVPVALMLMAGVFGQKKPGALFERTYYEATVPMCISQSDDGRGMIPSMAQIERSNDYSRYQIYSVILKTGETLRFDDQAGAANGLIELWSDSDNRRWYVDLYATCGTG